MMIWRLLGSVLLNRRQPQTMKQAMNDGKNKTDALRSDACVCRYPPLSTADRAGASLRLTHIAGEKVLRHHRSDQTKMVLDCMDARTERVSPPISYARKNADGSWYVAVTWGNGRKEQLGPIKLKLSRKNSSKRSWPHGMRGKSYF